MAGLTEVPAIIRELTDSEVMEIALIENLQREDLTPIEEALGYKSLIDSYNLTQDEVAKTVGKSRSTVSNAVRLLSLPQSVIDLISQGVLTSGHARALLTLTTFEEIELVAKKAAEKFLSVREVEKI
jgi:ParB family chromosome partitioning protein